MLDKKKHAGKRGNESSVIQISNSQMCSRKIKPTLSITITHLIASTFSIDQWERDGSGNASKIREEKNPKKKGQKRKKKVSVAYA